MPDLTPVLAALAAGGKPNCPWCGEKHLRNHEAYCEYKEPWDSWFCGSWVQHDGKDHDRGDACYEREIAEKDAALAARDADIGELRLALTEAIVLLDQINTWEDCEQSPSDVAIVRERLRDALRGKGDE